VIDSSISAQYSYMPGISRRSVCLRRGMWWLFQYPWQGHVYMFVEFFSKLFWNPAPIFPFFPLIVICVRFRILVCLCYGKEEVTHFMCFTWHVLVVLHATPHKVVVSPSHLPLLLSCAFICNYFLTYVRTEKRRFTLLCY